MRYKILHILNTFAILTIFACAMVIVIQLIAIPQDMATGELMGKGCTSYIGNKQGWGCARFETITMNPEIAICAFVVTLVSALWLKRDALSTMSLWSILKSQFVFYILIALIVRIVYFIQGAATIQFVLWLIPSVFFAGYFLFQIRRSN